MRHGETDWNVLRRFQGRTDVPLNDRGREQALQSAIYLSAFHWDQIVTSPLGRAKETAQIIAQHLHLGEVETIEQLAERDVGNGTGFTPEQFRLAQTEGRLVGIETHDQVKDRAMAALQLLVMRYKAKRVIAVSHGAVINAVLAELSNGEIGTGKTALQNVCLNTLHFHPELGWEIESFNVIDHLRKVKGEILGSLTSDLDLH
ncbi:hypothetical protein BM613_01325 [Sulfoacidibacillus thermotolerans]|uniref:Histidine phosphatase family protein n=2 Tax=Sulfoacidibacillus thermotolerans TaxID=1765684 RepID=A0A2U3DCI8_SULT2|nr:hypothetical protein BM613_01325 [Sulfoacidibacillus thermotolerans]